MKAEIKIIDGTIYISQYDEYELRNNLVSVSVKELIKAIEMEEKTENEND